MLHEPIVPLAGLGALAWVAAGIWVTCWSLASYRLGQRIRVKIFRAILRHEIGWFDVHETVELNNRLAE